MAAEFDISKEAAARRYVELHPETLAVVFSKDDCFTYVQQSADFPWLCLEKAHPMPFRPPPKNASSLNEMDEVEPVEWLNKPSQARLSAQCLYQRDGYAKTLLHTETAESDDSDGMDDTYQRFSRFKN